MYDVSCGGASIPALGFGTLRLNGDTARRLVGAALEIGYRHFDTAPLYGNEAEVGAALSDSGLRREELFVTTKVYPDRFRGGDLERSVEESATRLGLRPDLVLLHWPNPEVPLAETVGALNRAAELGLARHIGVSNFTAAMLDEAVRLSARPLVADQVEYHPFLSQQAVLARCRAHGLSLTAYCPLARGRVSEEPVLARIGAAYGKGPGQVTLRWLVQQEGVVAISRSSSIEHARSNFEVFDFALSATEMAEIAALGRVRARIINAPRFVADWDAA